MVVWWCDGGVVVVWCGGGGGVFSNLLMYVLVQLMFRSVPKVR